MKKKKTGRRTWRGCPSVRSIIIPRCPWTLRVGSSFFVVYFPRAQCTRIRFSTSLTLPPAIIFSSLHKDDFFVIPYYIVFVNLAPLKYKNSYSNKNSISSRFTRLFLKIEKISEKFFILVQLSIIRYGECGYTVDALVTAISNKTNDRQCFKGGGGGGVRLIWWKKAYF